MKKEVTTKKKNDYTRKTEYFIDWHLKNVIVDKAQFSLQESLERVKEIYEDMKILAKWEEEGKIFGFGRDFTGDIWDYIEMQPPNRQGIFVKDESIIDELENFVIVRKYN